MHACLQLTTLTLTLTLTHACLQLTTGFIDDKCPADPGNTNTKYGNYPTLLNLPITPETNYCAAPAGVPYCTLHQQESWSAYRCVPLKPFTQIVG